MKRIDGLCPSSPPADHKLGLDALSSTLKERRLWVLLIFNDILQSGHESPRITEGRGRDNGREGGVPSQPVPEGSSRGRE